MHQDEGTDLPFARTLSGDLFGIGDRVKPALSLVVPVYNEAERLPASRGPLLALTGPDTELIFVDDGSHDSTPELLRHVAAESPNVAICTLAENRGKGAAVRAGVAHATGSVIAFMDADLATDPKSLGSLQVSLESADVVVGSRAVEGARVHDATRRRSRAGGLFNGLVRTVTGLPFRDTQCGFKGFRAHAAKLLFGLLTTPGFSFDVEILSRAMELGLRVSEIPVDWTEMPGSHVSLARDGLEMGAHIVAGRVLHSARRSSVPALSVGAAPDRALDLTATLEHVAADTDSLLMSPTRAHLVRPFASENDLSRLSTRIESATTSRPTVEMVELSSRQITQLARTCPGGLRSGADMRQRLRADTP